MNEPTTAVLETRGERKFASRKWILVLLCIAIATSMCATGRISGSEWIECTFGLVALYMVGNVGAAAVGAVQAFLQRRAP